MKNFNHFLQYIFINILFFIFKILGFKNSSDLGNFIGKNIGSIFRSKKLIIQNLKKAGVNKNLDNIASNVLGNYGRIFAEYVHLKNFKNNKLKKFISIDGYEHLENMTKNNHPVDQHTLAIMNHVAENANAHVAKLMKESKVTKEAAKNFENLNNVFYKVHFRQIAKACNPMKDQYTMNTPDDKKQAAKKPAAKKPTAKKPAAKKPAAKKPAAKKTAAKKPAKKASAKKKK